MLEENLSSMAYLKTFSAWAKERMRKARTLDVLVKPSFVLDLTR